MNAKFFALTPVALLFFVGCGTPGTPARTDSGSATYWSAGDYSVAFHAGPRNGERTFSCYEVVHRGKGREPQRLVLESAQSIEGFATVSNGAPENHIRVVSAPGGKAILIEEDIPNDCGPCRNFAFIRPDGEGLLTPLWLGLPEKSYRGEAITSEFPVVARISGSTVTYCYSDGETRRANLSAIPLMEGPQRPG